MKKVITIFLTMIFLLSVSVSAKAGELKEKEAEIVVSASSVEVTMGETVNLTARITKHGSSFVDVWEGAAKESTCLDEETGEYVAMAVYTAEKPGTYTVTYSIKMKAGKSNVMFYATALVTIKVTGAVEISGADVRDLVITPVKNASGTITSYTAFGDSYVLWSDGSATLYGSIYFVFGANQMEKIVNVNIISGDKEYLYPITVTRQ